MRLAAFKSRLHPIPSPSLSPRERSKTGESIRQTVPDPLPEYWERKQNTLRRLKARSTDDGQPNPLAELLQQRRPQCPVRRLSQIRIIRQQRDRVVAGHRQEFHFLRNIG